MKIIRPGTFTVTAPCDQQRMNFDARNEQLGFLDLHPDAVFIGDDTIRFYALNLYYPSRLTLINRGVEKDTPQFIAKRFFADCVQLRPRACVYLAGSAEFSKLVSNFWVSDPALSSEEVKTLILDGIRDAGDQADKAQILFTVCSLLPEAQTPPDLITQINRLLREMCSKKGWLFADLASQLSEGGRIRKQYSSDGRNLNYDGYRKMTELLRETVPGF